MTPLKEAREEIVAWYRAQKFRQSYSVQIEGEWSHLVLTTDKFTGPEIMAVGLILTKHGATWYVVADDNRGCGISARFPKESQP